MSNLWFYILCANIIVLGTNIWLFTDSSQEQPDPKPEVKVEMMEVPSILKIPSIRAREISSVESFHFPLMDPLPSKEQQLEVKIAADQQKIAEQNAVLLKASQQNNQHVQRLQNLQTTNDRLQKQLSRLTTELQNQQQLSVAQRNEIETLKKQEAPLPAFESESDFVKGTIEAYPDLIKSKPNSTESVQSEAPKDEAQDNAQDDVTYLGLFSGSVEFGFSYEHDNQETKSLNGRFILDYDQLEKYNFNSDLDFEFKSEDHVMSTEKYRWQLQSGYNLDPNNLLFARSDLSRSQFSSYRQEDVFTVGYGHVVFNTDRHKFNVEIGPGYRFASPNDGKSAVSIDEFIVRTRLKYERVVSESLQVSADAVLEAGHNNSVYSASLVAQNRIYQELYLIFSFDYKYTENVPIDTVNKEVSSGMSLLYAF